MYWILPSHFSHRLLGGVDVYTGKSSKSIPWEHVRTTRRLIYTLVFSINPWLRLTSFGSKSIELYQRSRTVHTVGLLHILKTRPFVTRVLGLLYLARSFIIAE